jgi:hypothetical protein
LDADLSIYTDMDDDEGERSSSRLLRVGRLLIWLIAPVAAETMKYGNRTELLSDDMTLLSLYASPSSSSLSSSSSPSSSSPRGCIVGTTIVSDPER